MKLLARWLLLASALLLLAQILPGVKVGGFAAALWVALVLGLLNTLVRPVLVLLTLPVTLITLGLFLFVINALLFWTTAWMLEGLDVAGFGTALLASLLYSAMGLVVDAAVERIFGNGG
jgi:putative membrane protein